MEAVEQSNLNVGGKVIEESGMEFVVRGLGLIESRPPTWKRSSCWSAAGTPIYLRDVAASPARRRFPPRRARRERARSRRRHRGHAHRRECAGRDPAA